MRQVDAVHFARAGSPTHWFHGPSESEIFLWCADQEIKKATVEHAGGFLQWQNGEFYEGRSADFLDSETRDPAASHIPFSNFPIAEKVKPADTTKATPFMYKVLELLLQVPDREKVLLPLIKNLAKKLK